MKRLIITTLLFMICTMIIWSQSLKIKEINIASNVSDTRTFTGTIDVFTFDFPRIKLTVQLSNNSVSTIIFYGETEYDQFHVSYVYNGETYIKECWIYYDMENIEFVHGTPILPGESIDFSIILPAGFFSDDNYVNEFMDMVDTLKIEYTRKEEGEIKYQLYASPFEYNSLTLSRKEPESLE